ncbi:MAG TPA: 3-phosphoshikimate 1-carboxyvinyltransferase, partial [Sphingobium sp.]|nr:3-phosphoshikimate 1-carboxyvinyltransferase [Sphingobium sp.]
VTVTNVGMNPTRSGLFTLLQAMGADLTITNERDVGGEPVADLVVRHSQLTGIEVPPDIAPSMIDEFPVFFVAASFAKGRTTTSGLDELRVKESDRLALMASNLARIGARVTERDDGLVIDGTDGAPLQGTEKTPTIGAELDHRIAMSFAVAGQATTGGVVIDDMSPVATSFPGFADLLRTLKGEA